MRWVVMLIVGMSAHSAQAKWAVSADTGAALVMPTGLEGQTETVGPNLGINLGYQLGNSLRFDVGAVLGQQGSGADIRPGGFQAIRPAVKAFVFGGGIYGKASIPLTLSGQSNLGLLVGGGYELKLLGLLGGFVEANTGYEGAAGGVVPMEMRAGVIWVW